MRDFSLLSRVRRLCSRVDLSPVSRPLTCASCVRVLFSGLCHLLCACSVLWPISLACSSVLACSLADLSAVPCARVLFSGRSIGCASCAGVFWLLSVGRRVVIYLSSSSRFHRYFVLLRLVRRYHLDFLPRVEEGIFIRYCFLS